MRSVSEIRAYVMGLEDKPPCIEHILSRLDRGLGPLSALILFFYLSKTELSYQEAKSFVKAYSSIPGYVTIVQKYFPSEKEFLEMRKSDEFPINCSVLRSLGYCYPTCSRLALNVKTTVALSPSV